MRETPPQPQPHTFTLCLCADPALIGADGSAKALERRAAALCALAALEPGISRARAAALLWPDSDNARRALRQQLSRFKKNFGIELVSGDETLRIADGVSVDVGASNPADAIDSAMAHAVSAELLAAFDYDDCADFTAWLQKQRATRLRRRVHAAAQAVAQAEARGNAALAVGAALRLIDLEPTHEAHHRTLMRLHYLNGDRAAAIAAFDRCVQVLRDDLGAQPDAETLALRHTVQAAAASAPTRAIPVVLSRPPRLIGRERELAQLIAACRDRQPFFIEGEAGMGKSRLLADLQLAQLQAASPRLLPVSCRPGDAEVPYALLARLVRALRAAGATGADGAEPWLIDALLPESRADWAQARAAAEPLHPWQVQHALSDLVAQLVPLGSGGIVIDDLHFADDASIDAIAALALDTIGGPLVYGLAARPAELPGAAAKARAQLTSTHRLVQVSLAPLDQRGIAALIESLGLQELDGATLAPGLLQASGGNPLFVLETLKSRWLNPDERSGSPPATVSAHISRRLSNLSREALALARVAAIAGADFTSSLAIAALDVRAIDLADPWAELEARQVFSGQQFAHDLVLDVVLAGIPQPVARMLHRTVAEHLEQPRGAPISIAQHWLAAGDPARAIEHFFAAAAHARRQSQPAAEAHALIAAADAARAVDDPAREFEALAAAGEALASLDRDPRGDAVQARLTTLAHSPQARARTALVAALLAQARGENAAAMSRAADAMATARDMPVADENLEVRVLLLLVDLASKLERPDLIEAHLPHLIALARTLQDAGLAALAEGAIAIALNNSDRHAEAAQHHRAAVQRYSEANNLTLLITELGNAATNARERGKFAEALELLREAQRLHQTADAHPNEWVYIRLGLGNMYRDQGNFGAALEHLEQALALADDRSTTGALVHHALALTHLFLGQNARALKHIGQAHSGATGFAWIPARTLWIQGRIERQLGRPVRALFEGALALAPSVLRRRLRWQIELALAREIGGDEGYALAGATCAALIATRSAALELVAEATLAEIATAQGDDRAEGHARRMLALLADVDAPLVYRPALQWVAVQALHKRAPPQSRSVLDDAAAWVAHAADTVPAEFKDAFLNRNPVNREIALLIGRLGATEVQSAAE